MKLKNSGNDELKMPFRWMLLHKFWYLNFQYLKYSNLKISIQNPIFYLSDNTLWLFRRTLIKSFNIMAMENSLRKIMAK